MAHILLVGVAFLFLKERKAAVISASSLNLALPLTGFETLVESFIFSMCFVVYRVEIMTRSLLIFCEG